jgi:spore coat protein A
VQIINRQTFDPEIFDGAAHFTGPAIPPLANEAGWKETVQMYPGTVTRVIMKFDMPTVKSKEGSPLALPSSPRTGGAEYVWHCHILEHEEHDMMRPLVVI